MQGASGEASPSRLPPALSTQQLNLARGHDWSSLQKGCGRICASFHAFADCGMLNATSLLEGNQEEALLALHRGLPRIAVFCYQPKGNAKHCRSDATSPLSACAWVTEEGGDPGNYHHWHVLSVRLRLARNRCCLIQTNGL